MKLRGRPGFGSVRRHEGPSFHCARPGRVVPYAASNDFNPEGGERFPSSIGLNLGLLQYARGM